MKKFLLSTLVLELLFIGISIYGIFKPDVEYNITTGRIVYIDEYYDAIDDGIRYTPYINYTVNGVEYKNVEYGAYDSSMKVNDEVNVYYLPDDPTFIQAEGYEKVPYVVLAISTIFLLITIFIFMRR